MKATRTYAQVLVDVVLAPGSAFQLPTIISELTQFSASTKESPNFAKVFNNPTLGDDDKQKVIAELSAKAGLSQLSARFLSLLSKRNRMNLLDSILKEVELIDIARRGGLMGDLFSAVPLEAGVVTGLETALSKRLHKPVQLKQSVDPSLIAGMRVIVNGVTYDGSVRGKLDQLAANI